MLVLSRRPKQTIRIGNDIEVTVLRVKGKQISVGIEAPRDVPVTRGEITEKPRGQAA